MKSYTFVNKPGVYQFAKQESIVFSALRELGSGTAEEIAEICMDKGLVTKQDPVRIVTYYIVSLKKLGLVTVSGGSTRKVTVVVEDEVAVE